MTSNEPIEPCLSLVTCHLSLHLKDVRGLEGDDFSYRLSLHDASPDCQVRAEPENPNISKGGSTYVTVSASRVQGYEGPIEISAEGLPAGVTASPTTIPAGEDSTVMLLSAAPSASGDALSAAFKVVGHAKINGHDLARVASEDSPRKLASVIPPPDTIVKAGPPRITLEPGQEVTVTLHVDRPTRKTTATTVTTHGRLTAKLAAAAIAAAHTRHFVS